MNKYVQVLSKERSKTKDLLDRRENALSEENNYITEEERDSVFVLDKEEYLETLEFMLLWAIEAPHMTLLLPDNKVINVKKILTDLIGKKDPFEFVKALVDVIESKIDDEVELTDNLEILTKVKIDVRSLADRIGILRASIDQSIWADLIKLSRDEDVECTCDEYEEEEDEEDEIDLEDDFVEEVIDLLEQMEFPVIALKTIVKDIYNDARSEYDSQVIEAFTDLYVGYKTLKKLFN